MAAGGGQGGSFPSRRRRLIAARQADCDQYRCSRIENPETFGCEFAIATNIASVALVEIVLSAVDLDDQPVLHAREIDDVAIARRLSAEMKPALSPGAEMNPELHLLGRHRLAQSSGD
jgi:hypothetical protein